MKAVGRKSTDSVFNIAAENYRTEENDQRENDLKILKVPVNDVLRVMYIRSSITISICVLLVAYYHQADLFV